jgi:hypothetical protein
LATIQSYIEPDEFPFVGAKLFGVGSVALGMSQRLIRSGDLDTEISRLIVTDTWPAIANDVKSQIAAERSLIASKKVIQLSEQQSLRTILRDRVWHQKGITEH